MPLAQVKGSSGRKKTACIFKSSSAMRVFVSILLTFPFLFFFVYLSNSVFPHVCEDNCRKSFALSDLLNLTAVRGRSYAEGTQRCSNAAPLRVPAYRSRLACRINCCLRPRELLAKGFSSIRLTAVLYQNYTSLDSGNFSRNFSTVTNLIRLKLSVQFDICCRTGLILSSLTEAKRNWTFAPRQRTDER